MSRVKDNDITQGLQGKFGKDVVFKTDKDGNTYATKAPGPRTTKSSKEQSKGRKRFAKAVKFAKEAINDPEILKTIQLKNYKTPYAAAIGAYLATAKPEEDSEKAAAFYTDKYLKGQALNTRQIKGIQWAIRKAKIYNGQYQKLTKTSKPTATRDLQDLVKRGIFEPSGVRGAGAFYTLIIGSSKP